MKKMTAAQKKHELLTNENEILKKSLIEATEILKQYLDDNGRGDCGECYACGIWNDEKQEVEYVHAHDCRLGKFMDGGQR